MSLSVLVTITFSGALITDLSLSMRHNSCNMLLLVQCQLLLPIQGGNTALHWASFGGHKDTVKLLVLKGAKVDSQNDVSRYS